MKICDNGIIRDMTQAEIDEVTAEPIVSDELTAEEIAEALAEVLS